MNPAEIVVTTGDAAFATDEMGRIVSWNEAAERLLGRSAAQVLGRQCHEVIGGTDVHGNPYCTENCVLLQTAHKRMPVRRLDLCVSTPCGRSLRAAFSTIRLQAEGPQRVTLLHLVYPLYGRKPIEDSFSAGSPAFPPRRSLTTRELEVLKLLAKGAGTAQVATVLSISVATVRTHIRNILAKLEVHSKLEAVCRGLRIGLI